MKTKRIAILGAIKEELTGLKGHLKKAEKFDKGRVMAGLLAGREALLAVTGIGSEAATKMARYLLHDFNIDYLISVGFAGGVKEGLEIGDILVCAEVLGLDGDTGFPEGAKGAYNKHPLDPKRRQEIIAKLGRQGIPFRQGAVLTVDRVVESVEEKMWIGENYPVFAVEMETFAIAEEAERDGVAMIAIRAVSDRMEDSLIKLNSLRNKDGNVSKLRAGLHAIAHPGDIPNFIALRESSKKAEKALAGAVLTGLS